LTDEETEALLCDIKGCPREGAWEWKDGRETLYLCDHHRDVLRGFGSRVETEVDL